MNAISRSISILCGAALIALSTTGTDAFAKKKKKDKGDKATQHRPRSKLPASPLSTTSSLPLRPSSTASTALPSP